MRHSSAEAEAFDLHVLGMPPAFVLSQDQTLMFILTGLPATLKARAPNPANRPALKGSAFYSREQTTYPRRRPRIPSSSNNVNQHAPKAAPTRDPPPREAGL